jgi:hypothetical protein
VATARKKWFRVADSVLLEAWSNDELAFFLRLGAYLNTRWARAGLNREEASEATIGPAALCQIAGCQRAVRARYMADRFAVYAKAEVRHEGVNTFIRWPKFAEFQEYASGARPDNSPSETQTPPQTQEEKSTTPAASPDLSGSNEPPEPKRRKAPMSEAPDDLSDEDKMALFVWCQKAHPAIAQDKKRLRGLVSACLLWHRSEGRKKRSWLMTCQVWINREAERPAPRGGNGGAPVARYVETADETRRARLEAHRAYERESGGFVPLSDVLSIVDSIAGGKR